MGYATGTKNYEEQINRYSKYRSNDIDSKKFETTKQTEANLEEEWVSQQINNRI